MWKLLPLVMVQWGAMAALFARSKQRNAAVWFAIGAVFPVFGAIAAMVISPKRIAPPKPARVRAVATPKAVLQPVSIVQLHRA
jgi:hypothetical protein